MLPLTMLLYRPQGFDIKNVSRQTVVALVKVCNIFLCNGTQYAEWGMEYRHPAIKGLINIYLSDYSFTVRFFKPCISQLQGVTEWNLFTASVSRHPRPRHDPDLMCSVFVLSVAAWISFGCPGFIQCCKDGAGWFTVHCKSPRGAS